MKKLMEELRCRLTWDLGPEYAKHYYKPISIDTKEKNYTTK